MSNEEAKKDTRRVHITPHKEVQTLILRESTNAPEIRQPVKVRIRGNIFAPQEWYEMRWQQELIDPKLAHVEVDRWQGIIKLYVNESDVEQPIITGTLAENPDLEKLGINQGNMYDKDSFVEMLKMNRHLFQDQSVNMSLVAKLKDFVVDVRKKIEDKDDHRGNINIALRQTAETDLPETFNLEMPIFRGKPSQVFEVELNFNVKSNSIFFWLTSPDLAEQIGTTKDKIIENALKGMDENLIIIEK